MDYYERKFRNSGPMCKVCFWCFVAIVLLLSVCAMTGCKTVKSVESHTETKTEAVRDSSDNSTVHADTAKTEHVKTEKEKEKTHTESHKEQKDSMVTVVDQQGNVIGTKEYHWLKETLREVSEREKCLEDSLRDYRHISDSIGRYRELVDSLSHVVKDDKHVEVEIQPTLWERIKLSCGGYAMLLILLVVLWKAAMKWIVPRIKI